MVHSLSWPIAFNKKEIKIVAREHGRALVGSFGMKSFHSGVSSSALWIKWTAWPSPFDKRQAEVDLSSPRLATASCELWDAVTFEARVVVHVAAAWTIKA